MIDELVEKYLIEDKQSDYKKLMKVIQTTDKEDQVPTVTKMIKNYYNKYGKDMGASEKVKFHIEVDKIRKDFREHLKKRKGITVSRIDVGLV